MNNYVELFTMTATAAYTTVDGSTIPSGGESIGTLDSMARSQLNDAGQSIENDAYYDLTDISYDATDFVLSGTSYTSNFYKTTYEYDVFGLLDRTQTANGVIDRVVHDGLGRTTSTWIGPSGSDTVSETWSPSNNTASTPMSEVTASIYDGGGTGDSTLTAVVAFPSDTSDASTFDVTEYVYNWRDELVAAKQGAAVEFTEGSGMALDGVSEPIVYYAASETDDGTTGANRPITYYELDNRGQVAYQFVYSGNTIDPSSIGDGGAPSGSYSGDLVSEVNYLRDNLERVYETDTYDDTGTYASDTAASFDPRGLVTESVDPSGNLTDYAYDGAQRTLAVTTYPDGSTASTINYGYDDNGNLTSETDAESNETQYVYDAVNRETEMIDPFGYHAYYNYDSAGNLTSTTDRDDQTIDYTYDNLGRVTVETWVGYSGTWGSNYVIDTTYGNSGVSSVSDPDAAYNYTYNNLGELETVDNTTGVVLTSGYDNIGERTSLDSTLGGTTSDFQNSYTYNSLGQMTQIIQQSASGVEYGGAGYVPYKQFNFSYTTDGQFSQIVANGDPTFFGVDSYFGVSAPIYTATYSYDALQRLGELTYVGADNFGDTSTFFDRTWEYNANNTISSQSNGGGGGIEYTYDHTNQLIGAVYTGALSDVFANQTNSYSGNGNPYATGVTVDHNEVTMSGDWEYAYDHNGNMITATNTTTEDVINYTYDYRNRLVKAEDDVGDVPFEIQYKYDEYDRLISRNDLSYGSPRITTFVYDGNNMVYSLGGVGVSHRLLYGPAVDQVLATDYGLTGYGSAYYTFWDVTDNQGTVDEMVLTAELGVVDSFADGSMYGVDASMLYDAFGNLTSVAEGLGYDSLDFFYAGGLGYTGKFSDPITGLQWNGARWYNPTMERWMSQDPTGLAPDSNPYRYCGNDPTNEVDPSGLSKSDDGPNNVTAFASQLDATKQYLIVATNTGSTQFAGGTGHSWVALVDKGTVTSAGYAYKGDRPSPLYVTVPGEVHSQEKTEFTNAVAVEITADQFRAANAAITARTTTPGDYQMRVNNCTGFAINIAKAAGQDFRVNPDSRGVFADPANPSDATFYSPQVLEDALKDKTRLPAGATTYTFK